MEAGLLVLDDLGKEKTSEWVEETLNLVVNTRYNHQRATIFTSNFEEKEDRTDPESRCRALDFECTHVCTKCANSLSLKVRTTGSAANEHSPDAEAHDVEDESRKTEASCAFVRSKKESPSWRDGRADLKWSGGRAGSKRIPNPQSLVPERPGLYVHVPFCSSICNYCNFNRGLFDETLKSRFVEALLRRFTQG